MKAAAELPNDMCQAISESERGSNGKWEPSWERRARRETHSAHRPTLLTGAYQCSQPSYRNLYAWVTVNAQHLQNDCNSHKEGRWSLSTHFHRSSRFTALSRDTVSSPLSLHSCPHTVTHWVPSTWDPNSHCPSFLPRSAFCSQLQLLVSAAWLCPSQLLFMDLNPCLPEPIGSSWPQVTFPDRSFGLVILLNIWKQNI